MGMPADNAHGFVVLSETAEVDYRAESTYAP